MAKKFNIPKFVNASPIRYTVEDIIKSRKLSVKEKTILSIISLEQVNRTTLGNFMLEGETLQRSTLSSLLDKGLIESIRCKTETNTIFYYIILWKNLPKYL